jgi:hypothetical protein
MEMEEFKNMRKVLGLQPLCEFIPWMINAMFSAKLKVF